ncbi:metallophosphoesterase family protein [Planococcus sp. FY231025]|uniref:metallophosphoesterase family protein n=1 Tax=Planococcus sp. FY231025 TaxID=3455699 RepID=UPI003F90794B
MREIRFIHTADLHLGSPFTGMRGLQKEQWKRLKDSTLLAFDRLVDYALEQRPDFLLVAGDIYDGENRSLRAQHRFQTGMQRLADEGIPVLISHGNHDHLSGKWTRFELPSNVHVFGAEVTQKTLTVRGMDVAISGFSYGERHVKESKVKEYPPAENRDAFYIGMLHGSLEGETAHAVYAPFSKNQLLEKNYDYWALGHIHQRQVLHADPPIVYPGNTQGRHRGESGTKGFYDVRLSKSGAELEFIQASVLQFDEVEVDCSGAVHMNELLEACSSSANRFAERFGPAALALKLANLDAEALELIQEIPEEELLETIRESVEALDTFMFVQRVWAIHGNEGGELSPMAEEIIAKMDSWEIGDWKTVLKDLYRHPKSGRYLEPLETGTAEEVKSLAAEKIRRSLGMGLNT